MANLPEKNQWPAGIYQLETTDPVIGGLPDLAKGEGIDNVPAQQLADRTVYLKDQIASVRGEVQAIDYTPADVLAKLLTVDGAASGLDADKLDGIEASQFARKDQPETMRGDMTVEKDKDVSVVIKATDDDEWTRLQFRGRRPSGRNPLGVIGAVNDQQSEDQRKNIIIAFHSDGLIRTGTDTYLAHEVGYDANNNRVVHKYYHEGNLDLDDYAQKTPSFGSVGDIGFFVTDMATTSSLGSALRPGDTISGSRLRYAGFGYKDSRLGSNGYDPAGGDELVVYRGAIDPSGTWRCLSECGREAGSSRYRIGLFRRIA